MGRREENAAVFQDTEKLCKTNQRLVSAIRNSVENQKLILEKDEVKVPHKAFEEPAKVVVSKKRTYEAAAAYKGTKVCVLNFASASNPGGGVVRGAGAQEECLCRCSTLYFNLNTPGMWNGFYEPHRQKPDPLHNDDCIYTPDVVVFKTDTAKPELMKEEDWFQVQVITCAAPNLRSKPGNRYNTGDGNQAVRVTDKELLAIHEKRLRRILNIVAAHGNETVILGAFGCGAFSNSPEIVAQAMKNVLKEYRYHFKTMEFAVYCPPEDDRNFRIFERVMRNLE